MCLGVVLLLWCSVWVHKNFTIKSHTMQSAISRCTMLSTSYVFGSFRSTDFLKQAVGEKPALQGGLLVLSVSVISIASVANVTLASLPIVLNYTSPCCCTLVEALKPSRA